MMATTRLGHAKRLVWEEFFNEKEAQPAPAQKARRCSSLAAGSRLYSPSLEQCRALAVALRKTAPRINKICESSRRNIIDAVTIELNNCFSGSRLRCFIGLLEPRANAIKIASTEVTLERTKEPLVFACVDQNKTVRGEESSFFNPPFLSVPLLGCIGVLVFDGFCESAISLHTDPLALLAGQKEEEVVENSLPICLSRSSPFERGDDEACKRVKLWRLNVDNETSARVVSGRVSDINRSRRRVVYAVIWEDGHRETDISMREMRELIRATPKSLGVGIPLDEVLTEFCECVGVTLGAALLKQRREVFTARILEAARQPGAYFDIYRTVLDACLRYVLRARIAEIWDYDKDLQSLTIRFRMEGNGRFQHIRASRQLTEIPAQHHSSSFWDRLGSSFVMRLDEEEIFFIPFSPSSETATATSGSLLSVTSEQPYTSDDDLSFMTGPLIQVAALICEERIRGDRRKLSLEKIRELAANYSIDAILAEIGECLQGARARLGRVQSNETLSAVTVITDPQTPQISMPKFNTGVRVEVNYGKLWYPATVTNCRGHDAFDIVYDAKDWMGRDEKEAGIPSTRLRILNTHTEQSKLVSALIKQTGVGCASEQRAAFWPVILVPLGESRQDILCVDSLGKDAWLRGETQVTCYLQKAGELLVNSLDFRRQVDIR